MARTTPSPGGDETQVFVVCVQGHLDTRWADWLEDMSIRHEADGTTTLEGPLPDQAALHGVLTKMRDLGIPIIAFRRLGSDHPS